MSLPEKNLVEIPDSVSDDEAVFAEPLAAAFGISELVDINAATKVAVIGDGKLGLLCAMSLALKSKSVTIIGKHPSKLSIAADSGVEALLVSRLSASQNRRFDVVIEASGAESGFATALDLVRPRGKIVLKSTFHGTPTWAASRVVVDEITVIGSRCGRFAPVIDLLERKAVKVTALIDGEFPLGRGVEAISRAGERGTLKILLRP